MKLKERILRNIEAIRVYVWFTLMGKFREAINNAIYEQKLDELTNLLAQMKNLYSETKIEKWAWKQFYKRYSILLNVRR